MCRSCAALVATFALVLVACSSQVTPGEMSTQAYRSLDARGADLTLEDARGKGATQSDDLARRFRAEGGAEAPAGAECLHAALSRRGADRGIARFCDTGGVVTAERTPTTEAP